MKRDKFLKLIGTGSGSFMLGNSLSTNHLRYNLNEITIYDNYLNGVKHYEKEFLNAKIKLGQKVSLFREKNNIHDKFAIAVILNGTKLGYIPAFENIVMANMMDKGVSLKATVSELNKKEFSRYRKDALAVKVTTQLMIPIQKIITEDLTEDRANHAPDRYRSLM